MAPTRFDPDAAPPTVAIGDELTFQTAADVRNSLLEAVEQATDELRIDVSSVASFDLAGVQLLYAAERSATGRGITLSVSYGDNEERFEKLYRFAGLKRIGGEAES